MKRREQALLLLRKAAQDEALLDQVLTSDQVSDEIIGFHCQQAAEKILKALLSDLGVRIRKTHEIGALMPSARSTVTRTTTHRFPLTGLRRAEFCDSYAFGWRASLRSALHRRLDSHTSGPVGHNVGFQIVR